MLSTTLGRGNAVSKRDIFPHLVLLSLSSWGWEVAVVGSYKPWAEGPEPGMIGIINLPGRCVWIELDGRKWDAFGGYGICSTSYFSELALLMVLFWCIYFRSLSLDSSMFFHFLFFWGGLAAWVEELVDMALLGWPNLFTGDVCSDILRPQEWHWKSHWSKAICMQIWKGWMYQTCMVYGSTHKCQLINPIADFQLHSPSMKSWRVPMIRSTDRISMSG